MQIFLQTSPLWVPHSHPCTCTADSDVQIDDISSSDDTNLAAFRISIAPISAFWVKLR